MCRRSLPREPERLEGIWKSWNFVGSRHRLKGNFSGKIFFENYFTFEFNYRSLIFPLIVNYTLLLNVNWKIYNSEFSMHHFEYMFLFLIFLCPLQTNNSFFFFNTSLNQVYYKIASLL